MSQLDDRIREALDQEQRTFFDQLEEPSWPMDLIETFKGQSKWLMILMMINMLLFTGLLFYSGYQFFQAETTKGLVGWAAGFLFFSVAGMAMKQWTWMELNKHSLTREIKRLELQVALLAKRLSEKENLNRTEKIDK